MAAEIRLRSGAHARRWAALAGALLPAAPAAAQSPWRADRTFSLYAENDALGGESDSSYTNGFRLTWDFFVWGSRLGTLSRAATLAGLADRFIPGVDVPSVRRNCVPYEEREGGRPCGTLSFGFTQTMYTPSNIVDTLVRPDERPYAGLLFASAIFTNLYERWQVSSELLAGVIGPWSHAEGAQSLAHWTWSPSSAKPRGWRHQLRNSLQVGIVNTYAFRALEWCAIPSGCNGSYGEQRLLDFTPRAEVAMGTHMRRLSGGIIGRAGWRFPDQLSATRIPTTRPQGGREALQPWIAIMGSYDQRYVFHNALLTGTSADRGGGGWRDIRLISPERSVSEVSYGVAVGVRSASFTFQMIERSKEYEPGGGRHRFGSVTFSLFTLRRAGS